MLGILATAATPATGYRVTVHLDLPTASGGITYFAVADVDLVAAGIALLAVAALGTAVALVRPGRIADLVADSQILAIVTVLVALANGIADVPALMLSYAATAGMVAITAISEREHRMLPYAVGAALGIVPWGTFGVVQVGALMAGTGGPNVAVRILTLVALVLVAGWSALQWARVHPRRAIGPAAAALLDLGGLAVRVALPTATAALVWLAANTV